MNKPKKTVKPPKVTAAEKRRIELVVRLQREEAKRRAAQAN